jgi:hypothetical protein
VLKLPPRYDSSAIVEELEGFFSRFLALNDGLAIVLALWSLATHLFEEFDAYPYLAITSPTKRCGKTRVSELISFVCFQPLQTVNISSAALYRTLKEGARTLLIDEAESLGRPRDDKTSALREILNSGYRKGAVVVRCKRSKNDAEDDNNGDFEPEQYPTYCPKVLVAIGRFQDTLADRCIEIRMERRQFGVKLERFRFARVQSEMFSLQREAGLWAQQYRKKVSEYYQGNDLPSLQDRDAELWLPLFSVCAIAAPHRLSELELHSVLLSCAKSAEEPADFSLQLLKDCRDIFNERREDKLPTSTILDALNTAGDKPWARWFDGQGLNPHGLSRLLRNFQIQPQNIRDGGRVIKGYLRQSFQECWERYL